ncbi:type II toxin-antitoxin system VapC family toxin [Archaeoglobus neptunius]|uniref:type II toxin-antitoxin system VapC family toxin n=1 Tax=Archaeoglobus neptunius TaxID=2798580 RepID=UPI001926A9F7|nr:type II toxin-antitoxin system VapC family toxin [Archaeoglobus neptunius]
MKVFIDANYIIYLKYSESDETFDYCVSLLKKLENHNLLTNIVVIDEVVWILNRKYGIELEEIFEFLDRIMNLVNIIRLDGEEYGLMKEIMAKYNLKPSDAIHAASMKRAGIRHIVSEDSDFDKVKWIKRIWMDGEIEDLQ